MSDSIKHAGRFSPWNRVGLAITWCISAFATTGLFAQSSVDQQLIEAITNGRLDLARQALGDGADPHATDAHGAKVLGLAASLGHADIVGELLAFAADPNQRNDVGATPLMLCTVNGHSEAAQVLILGGANLDGSRANGDSALHLAVRGGHIAIAEQLIKAGADVRFANEAGLTPLDHARAQSMTSIVDLMVDPVKGQTDFDVPLEDAIRPEPGADLTAITLEAKDGDTIVLSRGTYQGPVIAQGIRVAIIGDAAGGTVIAGPSAEQSPIAMALEGGRIDVANVAFKFNSADQIGIYASDASAAVKNCQFDAAPSYAIYADAGAALWIDSCQFRRMSQPGVVAVGGSAASVSGSEFVDCAGPVIHIEDRGSLYIDGSEFRQLQAGGIFGAAAASVVISASQFNSCDGSAISLEACESVLVRDNRISMCRRAIEVVQSPGEVFVRSNEIVGQMEDSDGIYIEAENLAVLADNSISGTTTGVSVFGAIGSQVAIAGNTVFGVGEGGVYLEGATTDDRPGMLIHNNAVVADGGYAVAIHGGTHAALSNNALISGRSIALSVQDKSFATLNGNLCAGDELAINLHETDGAKTSLRREIIAGSIGLGNGEPSRSETTRQLDAVLDLMLEGSAIHRSTAALIAAAYGKLAGNNAAFDTHVRDVRHRIVAARSAATELASIRLQFEDAIGHARNSPFEVFDGTSPTIGSVTFWAGDLKDASGLLIAMNSATEGLAFHLRNSADESTRAELAAAGDVASNSVKRLIANELNRLIDGPLLLQEAIVGDLNVDMNTRQLCESAGAYTQSVPAEDEEEMRATLRQANRQVIEHVFPYQLARSRRISASDAQSEWAHVPAGKYWIVPGSDDSRRTLVTLESGQRWDQVTTVERSLWIQFQPNTQQSSSWLLFVPREREHMQKALKSLRIPGPWNDAAMSRAGVNPDERERARQLALQFLEEATRIDHPNVLQQYAVRDDVLRILTVAAEAADIPAIIAAVDSAPGTARRHRWAALVASIESRLGLLDHGSLREFIDTGDSDWAVPAAIQLHRRGITTGDQILQREMQSSDDFTLAGIAASMMLDVTDSETQNSMRSLLRRIIGEIGRNPDADAALQRAALPCVLYLIVYGTDDDLRLIREVSLDSRHLFFLSFLSADPISTAQHIIPLESGFNRSSVLDLAQGFLDRSPEESQILYARFLRAIAMNDLSRSPELDPRQGDPFNNSLNASNLYCSHFMPNRTAVRFYGRFGRVTPLEPGMDPLIGMPNLLADLPWFAEPGFVDRYIGWWADGDRAFQYQLEYVETSSIEQVLAELGGDVAPYAPQLYLAAHQVSTRSYMPPSTLYPRGLDRRTYVLRHHGDTSGGISGVAEMRYTIEDGSVRVFIQLRQAALYHAGSIIDRTAVERFAHHAYMIDDGRALVESVRLRRAGQSIDLADAGSEGGVLQFTLATNAFDPAGWYLDVTLDFLGQRIPLTWALFDAEAARQFRALQLPNN